MDSPIRVVPRVRTESKHLRRRLSLLVRVSSWPRPAYRVAESESQPLRDHAAIDLKETHYGAGGAARTVARQPPDRRSTHLQRSGESLPPATFQAVS
jgi:hypothetical protein